MAFARWFGKKEKQKEAGGENEAKAEAKPAEATSAEAEVEELESDIESESDSDEADSSDEAAKARPGFLKSAWEKTKQIALTPVDPYFEKMAEGLNRTRKSLVGQLQSLFRMHGRIDEDFWEELEDILITSDVGASATDRILDDLKTAAKEKKIKETPALYSELRRIIAGILGDEPESRQLNLEPGRLNVILMVGVNGAGKTTSTAKLANLFKEQDMKVLLAAADTFRAAAIEQLESWSKKVDVELIKHKEGADPAAVVFDAVSAAKARGSDVLLIDTAGRLHSKTNLMKELEKIGRIIEREVGEPAHDVLLVLDATTGQNALQQTREFARAAPVTGLILCKLDGTAKGGIMVAIAQEHSIPVKFIGVGEALEDLRPFEPSQFLDALFGPEEIEEAAEG